jgi:hypothetical protein
VLIFVLVALCILFWLSGNGGDVPIDATGTVAVVSAGVPTVAQGPRTVERPAAVEPTGIPESDDGVGHAGVETTPPTTVPVRHSAQSKTARASSGSECFKTPDFPMTGLEQEVQRVYHLSIAVMAEINATYWPTDGTLLGMMRNGRIVTDRDVDLQIHATYKTCGPLLASLRGLFAKRAKIKSFKVVYAKTAKHGKVGRYVMVRLIREHGTFDTGVDFNCVYTDEPERPTFHVHKGTLEPVPLAVFPLGKCRLYDRDVPCPRDGYSVLEALKPRYDGCMVFPHCLGNPTISVKKCMSPHPMLPLADFVSSTRQLQACGYTALADHYDREPSCRGLAEANAPRCEQFPEGRLCFVQPFKG